MQTSGPIATAAVAQERDPVVTLKVDWDADGGYSQAIDDLSSRVETLTIERMLASDLPDEVAREEGHSSAQLTATLSGDPTTEATNAGAYFSPFNTASALNGKRRRWRTCQAQIGFDTTLLPVFTGKTSGLIVDSASRTATLTAQDNAENMRGVVDLPLVVADDHWRQRIGLNASWVVDYIARQCGYYASPPTRTSAIFAAPFAGSLQPFVGTVAATGINLPTFITGKFIQALNTNGLPSFTTSGTGSTNNNSEVLIEGWMTHPAYTGPSAGGVQIASLDSGTFVSNRISLSTSAAGHLVVAIARTTSGVATTYDSGLSVAPSGSLTYVAVHIYMTSSTITMHWRVGGTSATTSASTVSVTGQPALTTFRPGQNGDGGSGGSGSALIYMEAWQVSNPGTTTSAPTWNDAFVPSATIQPSLNTLAVTAPSQASAWEQLQQIAAAEFATIGFDESGTFTFYTRNRWTAAPYTTSQRTINAADSLTAIATSEAIDQVRNHVRLTATIATVNAAGWVWATANVISVAASSSTTVTVDLGQPVYNLSTSIRYSTTNGWNGQSQYRASRSSDGSGAAVSNLTFTVTTSAAQIVTIVITNPNAFAVYLVTPTTGFTDPQGTPSLALWGQPVDFTLAQQPDTASTATKAASKQIIDISDATSIGQHGDQLLEISGNPWLQDVASLTTLANDLLARLKDPVPILDGLSIVGDPRLQLGDRITVIEPNLGLNGDFFITGIVSTFDASGYTQALTVRGIS